MRKLNILLLVLSFVISAQITRGQEPKPSPTAAPEGQEPKTSTGVPPGFQITENPDSGIFSTWKGRRNISNPTPEVANAVANVTGILLEKEVVYSPCTTKSSTCAGDEAKILITTEAEDKENDVLTYAYTVDAGKIIGQGANVIWDLVGVSPGQYMITAGVNDGCGICGTTMTTVEIKAVPDVVSISFDKDTFATWCPSEKMFRSASESPCRKSEMYVNVKTLAKNADAGMTYYYIVSGGEIVGEGAEVKWVFGEAPPGEYAITVGIGRDNVIPGKTLSRTISRRECSHCHIPCECATVSASGPEGHVKPGDTIVLTSKVEGPGDKFSYKWMISAGNILNDPKSSSIMVKIPADFKESEFLATFQLDGTNPACNCPREVTVTVKMLGTKPTPEREL